MSAKPGEGEEGVVLLSTVCGMEAKTKETRLGEERSRREGRRFWLVRCPVFFCVFFSRGRG